MTDAFEQLDLSENDFYVIPYRFLAGPVPRGHGDVRLPDQNMQLHREAGGSGAELSVDPML